VATPTATPSAISTAHCALIFSTPSSTISVTIGSAALTAVRPSECATGSKSWV
jgi:hypothetical protein